MDKGCGNAKTICSICYEDLKPIVEDLQSISICGHVFHELCLQQWFEYCSSSKKYSCPMCKQNCTVKDVGRLYFQSIGDANDLILTEKPVNSVENDPETLRIEVRRLEVKVSGLTSTLDRQGKDLGELNEELNLCRDRVKKEVDLRNEALKQKASMCQLLHIKTEELDKSTVECKRLQERSMALAKELAAFKLVSELDLDEEEVLKLASLGSGANNKETIDILRKSLVMRNRSYKELMTKCNLLGRGEARSCKNLDKAKEKINKLKARLKELEKATEAKDNEVLRVLTDSKKASIQGVENSVCCKCNIIALKNKSASPDDSGPTASLINDTSSRKSKKVEFAGNVYKNDMTLVDSAKDICSSMDKNNLEFLNFELGHLNPNLEYQNSEETNQRSYDFQSKTCSMSRKNAAEGPVNTMSSTATANNTNKTTAIGGDKSMPFVIEDITECEPVLNIRKESCKQLPPNRPGEICFSGGLLGPDGSNRFLGKWCKRGQTNGSGTTKGSSTGNLIVVGADGRGGKIKVIRSHNESSRHDMTSAGAKRFKYGVNNANLHIENFFSRC